VHARQNLVKSSGSFCTTPLTGENRSGAVEMNQERHKRPLQEEKRAQIAVEKMAGRLSTLSPVIRATTKDENNIYERFYFKPEVRQ